MVCGLEMKLQWRYCLFVVSVVDYQNRGGALSPSMTSMTSSSISSSLPESESEY